MAAKVGIKHVTVIGGGLMGSGIAQVAAVAGYKVTLVETSNKLIENATANIKKSIQRIAKKKYQDDDDKQLDFIKGTTTRITGSTDVKSAVKETDLVIEAIAENIKLKRDLFSIIDEVAPHHTLFTTNTSSLLVADIASATKRRDRFGGTHFFNPAPLMKLIEIIRIPETSDETHNSLKSFGESLGKVCITCKDSPGFVVNGLLVPYVNEAIRMLERGDASARDIDTAMKLGAGYPMGPLELADYGGLDVTNHILKGWHEKYPDNPMFNPIPLLDKLVAEGKLGIKSGEGFYSYKSKK